MGSAMDGLGEELRRVWKLAWPVSAGMLAMLGMTTVDTLFIAPLGDAALGAVVLANTWFFACSVLALGALRVIDPLVAQAHGAEDRDAIGRVLVHAVGLALALCPPMIALLLFASPGLTLLGQPAALIPDAGRYCGVLTLGIPGMFVFNALRQVLQAVGEVRAATVVLIAANVVNAAIVATLVLALGVGPLGCAFSTALCNTFMALALGWATRERLREMLPDEWRLHARWSPVLQLLRTGAPLGVQMGTEAWAFTAAGVMMGWLGEPQLAAHGVVLNLASLSFMIPLGVSAAAATRVGNLVGAGQPWGRAAAASLVLGGGVMAGSGTIFATLPEAVVGLYRPEEAVRAVAVSLLPIAAAFQLFDGLQVVSFGVLRGAGDLRVPSLANLLGYWLIGLPLGAWLAFRAGWGPVGVWSGLAVGLSSVALLLVARIVFVARRGAARLRA
jgi:MATE family multidrug resistance protein